MSNRELPMMPWYPDQFAASTEAWSFAEAGLYRCLLDAQWKLGVLPPENTRLARIAKMELTEFEAAWKVVRPKFVRTKQGGLINKRLEYHRLSALGRKEQLSEGGRKGGQASALARLKRGLKPGSRQAQARPTASGNPLLHSSHNTLKRENLPLSLGLEAPPRPRRRRATPAPQTDIHKPGNGAAPSTAEKPQASAGLATPLPETDDLRQKVRKLSTDGQLSTGEIVKALSQYSVTPEQVEAWLAETP